MDDTYNLMEEFAEVLRNPTTTVDTIKEKYAKTPLVSAHMLEDLMKSKNPHKEEIARFLYETKRFCMGGYDLYLALPVSNVK